MKLTEMEGWTKEKDREGKNSIDGCSKTNWHCTRHAMIRFQKVGKGREGERERARYRPRKIFSVLESFPIPSGLFMFACICLFHWQSFGACLLLDKSNSTLWWGDVGRSKRQQQKKKERKKKIFYSLLYLSDEWLSSAPKSRSLHHSVNEFSMNPMECLVLGGLCSSLPPFRTGCFPNILSPLHSFVSYWMFVSVFDHP